MTEQFVSFGDVPLLGIVTPGAPGRARPDLPALLLLNAGLLNRVGPHRLYVTLARRLSQAGVTTLRFDFSGIGDSPPRRDRLPLAEARLRETRDAMRLLVEGYGQQRFVVGGLCRGAVNALRVANADERVAGVLLIDPPAYRTLGFYVHRYLRRLLRARSWVNLFSGPRPLWRRLRRRGGGGQDPDVVDDYDKPPRRELEAELQGLLRRGTDLLVVHTAGLLDDHNHRGQFRASFPALRLGDRLRYEYLPASDHTCTLRASQQVLLDTVEQWFGQAAWSEAPRTSALGRRARRAARKAGSGAKNDVLTDLRGAPEAATD